MTIAPPANQATPPSRRGAPALLARCLLLGVIAALPVAFSAMVDPARLVTSRAAESAIARALAAGHRVTDVTNYDDRAIQRELARLRSGAPDLLAIGSSRAQPMDRTMFPAARAFVNGAVSGGTLDDMLGVYALYDEPGRRPSRLLLEVDPWTLRGTGDDGAWGSLLHERARMLGRIGEPQSTLTDRVRIAVNRLKRVASPEYFRLAWYSFRRYGRRGIPYVITDRAQNAEKTMAPDGSLVWYETSPSRADTLVRDYVATHLAGDVRYYDLDGDASRRAEARLERFVRHVRAGGTPVTLLLVPFHPVAWKAFRARDDLPLVRAEARFRGIAARAGAEVTGSYDPARCGVGPADFFDESHARPDALARIVMHGCGP